MLDDHSFRHESTTILTKTTASGILVTNATGGQFSVGLAPSDTGNLRAGAYPYFCRITTSSGEVYTIAAGIATIFVVGSYTV